MSDKTISLKVITPERVFFEGDVKQFIVRTKGEVGDFAVLADHAPLTSAIGLGKLEIELPNGDRKISTLFEGYAVINANRAVIICNAAEWPEEIDAERAENSKSRAENRLQKTSQEDIDFKRAEASLYRAITRLSLKK